MRACECRSLSTRESQRSIAWDRVPWKDRWSQMMPCPDEIGRCGSREAKGRQARTRRSPQSAIFHRSKPINEVQRKCSISDMPNIYARNLADRMRNRRWERRAGRPNLLRFKPSFVLIHAVIQMDTISQFVRRRPSRTLASPSGAAGVRSAALAQSLPTTGTKFSVGPVGRL